MSRRTTMNSRRLKDTLNCPPVEQLLYENRGVALIVTIMAISIIVALSVQFNRKMRDQLASAANIDQGIKALYIAKSGISYALAFLEEDERRVDTLQDTWSNEVGYIKQISEESNRLFDLGFFQISIEDLSAKIQINRIVDINELNGVFERLLAISEFEIDNDRKNEIVDSIKDWIDQAGEDDDLTRLNGAEDDYYLSLENPYHCKNGPLDSVEELLFVKGMTPGLLGSNDADEFKLHKYLTVFGDDGKININTAPPKILESLHEEMTRVLAEELEAYRKDKEPDDPLLQNSKWYKEVWSGIDLSDKIITTQSTHFKITSIGTYGDIANNRGSVKRKVTAVYRRDPEKEKGKSGFQLLAWKIE